MRAALVVASLLLALLAGGCSSDGDDGQAGPRTATTADFCQAFDDFRAALADVDPSDAKAAVRKLKDEATKLGGVGTPTDIPDDAGQGFQVVLDAIADIPDDASLEDLASVEGGLSAEEQKQSKALSAYLKKACPDL